MRDRWLYAWGLGSMSFGAASLLVPLYIVQLGASAVDLGLLAASAALIGAPGAIVFGRLADAVGYRRRLVLLTLATVAIALVALPFLQSIPAVILANAVLWLVVAAVAPVVTMLVVAESPEQAWSERIGRLNTYQGYGWAGGLVLGAVWPAIGRFGVAPGAVTRSLFLVLGLLALGSTLWAARTLPRPDPADHVTGDREVRRIAGHLAATQRGIRGATFAFVPNRLYWTTRTFRHAHLRRRFDASLTTYLVAAGLFFTGFAAFWAPLPLFLTGIGFDTAAVFAVYLVSSVGAAVLYAPAGTIATRYNLGRLQAAGLAVRGVLFPTTVLVAGAGSVPLKLAATALALAAIGCTWAIIAVVGTAIVTRLTPATVRGEALGVYTALAAVGGGAGGLLGGWLATIGYAIAFGIAAVLVLLGAGLVLSLSGLGRTPG